MSEYISKTRCSLAAGYLKESELTVETIAKKVGLLNGITLNRIFKKYYGITPGQYRDLKSDYDINNHIF
jgi:two-component system response regulator YesN